VGPSRYGVRGTGYPEGMPKSIPPTPSAPAPLAPYSVAAEAAGLVFVSGQVAIDPATGERAPDDVTAQARRVMDNIGTILGDLGLGYEDIAKTTIFLADIGDFPKVNEVYGSYFPSEPPARSTFQAGALPGGFLVEIEVVAAR
jgi:2-iminobutanoate/2-iminopropanoate deaminase